MGFYAYLYIRDDGTPYYAGKGCRNRAFSNSGRTLCHRPKDGSRILIFERASEKEAFETEIELIRNWGRKDLGNGCLYNMTDGGEGASGYKFTEEQKQKFREINKGEGNPFFGKKHGDGFRVKRLGHTTSEESRAKMSKARLGKPNLKTRGHKNYQNATSEQLSGWAKIAQEKQVGIFAPGFDRTKGLRAARAKLSPEEAVSRATKASHSIPPEQRVLNGKLGALKGAHIRYHVNRGIKSESCKHCTEG